MSDEAQQYSIDNQREAIQEYAARHGFTIVKTYADSNRTGVIAKNRTALLDLLKDVVNGTADYKAVLVYDVSRWGRHPNNDEAVHYEFLCSNSGIPLHYCAEPFINDGSASSSILKALKRSMAAEFSRELGEKVFRGKARIVRLGFWVGGPPGYGYRRMMISANGRRKQQLEPGEHKSITTDRVILIPGPHDEVEWVRHMFSMAIEGKGCSAIARDLNGRGIMYRGKPWEHQHIAKILANPKYAGCNVWHRRSQRLHGKGVRVAQQDWIMKPGAFTPIVDQQTFERARDALPKAADFLWSDEEILKKVRRLLKSKGRLTEALLQNAKGMPSTTTLHNHFGTYQQLYDSMRLRRSLVGKLKELFPNNIVVTHLPRKTRPILLIDNAFMVSVLLCRPKRRSKGRLHWVIEPCAAERPNVTLLCTMNCTHDRVLDYYVFPGMDMCRSHRLY